MSGLIEFDMSIERGDEEHTVYVAGKLAGKYVPPTMDTPAEYPEPVLVDVIKTETGDEITLTEDEVERALDEIYRLGEFIREETWR